MVIDDEPLAIQLLANHISKVSFLEMTSTFTNPMEGLISFNSNPVDLIFSRYSNAAANGYTVHEIIAKPCAGYHYICVWEYAIDGFEHNVADYLLKPISFERFYKAVEKVYNLKNPSHKLESTQDLYPATGGYIFVKVETKMVRVELDDILFIEGPKKLCFHLYQNTTHCYTPGNETT
jgi:DNA-binding LytR/AlgR family response regulator